MTTFAPGSVVVVRDEEWLVTGAEQTTDGWRLDVVGLGELVRETTATFFSALDHIELLDPRQARLLPDASTRHRRTRLWLEATLRRTPMPVGDVSLTVSDGMLVNRLEYQRRAAAHALSPANLRPRVLIADAVGLGKTLEIGMLLAELTRRGRADRVLVVTPRHVLEQMQHELWCRFGLPLVRLDSDGLQRVRQTLPASRNPFTFYRRIIVSIDTLKSPRYKSFLERHRWDAVVIDESHNLTNTGTLNNELARVLAPNTEALILASATPHNGKKESFAELLRLLDPTAVGPDGEYNVADVERLFIRRHRHSPEVAAEVGAEWALRPEPMVIPVPASPAEDAIATELSRTWLYPEGPSPVADRGSALFPWTLAKAFLSSPAALLETAEARIKRIVATTDPRRERERQALERLRALTQAALDTENENAKLNALVDHLRAIGVGGRSSTRAVLFAERVATLRWLAAELPERLGLTPKQVAVMHGALPDVEQERIVDDFKTTASPVRLLITGDVASEGVNLHAQCHHLIHVDIPWSLIRIEQRNGRIDRYGQKHPPQIAALALLPSDDRFSGDVRVLQRLLAKEHLAHTTLGDAATLMHLHSTGGEEDALRDALARGQDLDQVAPDPGADGSDFFDLFDTQFATSGDDLPPAPPDRPRESLYAGDTGDADFLADAVAEVYDDPARPPDDGRSSSARGGGVGWKVFRGQGLIALTPPRDLRVRLDALPASYVAERGIREQLLLATSRPVALDGLRAAREGQASGPRQASRALPKAGSTPRPAPKAAPKAGRPGALTVREVTAPAGSTWPEAHFLSPLHPVLDWAADKVLAAGGRNEVPLVRGPVDVPRVLVLATLMNRRGQVVTRQMVTVEFPTGRADLPIADVVDGLELFAGTGLLEGSVNPGPAEVTDDLAALVPAAIDAAARTLDLAEDTQHADLERRLADWSGRRSRWRERAAQLELEMTGAGRAKVRRLTKQVSLEEEIAQSLKASQRLLRPLAVVVPMTAHMTAPVPALASADAARARQQHSLSPETDVWLGSALDDARLAAWVRGVLERIRVQGGIRHRWLEPYIDHDGNRWFLTGGRRVARDEGLPAFPPGRPAPAFPTTGARTDTLDSITGASSWYARWAQRQLHLTTRDGGLVTRALLEEMAAAGWLSTRRTETNATVYALDPARIIVGAADPAGLADGSLALRCDVCQTLTPGTRRTIDDLDGAACLRQACPGILRRARRGDDYYRQLYRSVDMRRVVAHEHTSLLPDAIRLDVERQFRDGIGPAVPNVLASTPTLELGIDIGDLSTVMLGSLPRSVASYVQRVGRAGRLTGNALVLAYVQGRGHNTQRLADPLELIDGDVRPPATYLDAIEILERQYVAWLVDRRSRHGALDPMTAAGVFSEAGWAPGTWMGDLLADAQANAAAYTDEFLALFGDAVRPDTAAHLRAWAGADLNGDADADGSRGEVRAGTPGDDAEGPVSGLARLLRRAAVEYRREADELGHRQSALQDRLPELITAADRPTATHDDRIAARLGRAELGFLRSRRTAMATQFWVSALEERGMLPNYSLLDDTVTLDVTLSWVDQDTQEFREEPRTYQRGSALALTEWAPGATFYAQATAVRIDAVDIDPEQISEAWQLRGYPFGAEYIRQLEVRWVNVGRAVEQAPPRTLAGAEVHAPLFVLCPGCGVVPAAQHGVRDPQEARHRAWCPHRARIDVPWAEVALGRTLRTQGVRILLPPQFTLDPFAGPSFRAALLLGLRELLGGAPDHLDILEVHLPVDGQDRTALLLHDRVPGGTGYLADLARPSRVRELLVGALAVVSTCPCADDGLLACSRCLLPFTPPALVERTSRTRAEQMIAEVLGGDSQTWDPRRLRSVADIAMPSLDSALELRFRRTFTDALRARGTSVQEIPQLAGTEVRFGVPGTVHRRWTLRPQVLVGGCRPDFELLCQDPAVPRVYIFTDGRTWHATPAHNRIADDAAKRSALRDAGHVVWAVTDDDVAVFEALARGEQAVPAGAAWYGDQVQRLLVRLRAGRIPAGSVSDATATADAVTQLVDWVLEPRPDAWKKLADGLPFALFDAPPRPIASRSELAGLACAALDPAAAPGGGAQRNTSGDLHGWFWHRDRLAVASAGWPRAPHDVGSVLIVDDRDESLTTDAGVTAWRCWLALSNILGHAARAPIPTALSQSGQASATGISTSATGAGTGAGTGTDVEVGDARTTGTTVASSRDDALSPRWADLLHGALDDAERTLLRGLARVGVPLPEQGFETDDGIPLDLAWPDARIAVLVHPDDALIAELTGSGWRIAEPDPAAVAALVAAAQGGRETR